MGTSASFNNPSYGGLPVAGPAMAPGSGTAGFGGAMPDLPTPEQLAPDVMNAASTGVNPSQCCQPPVPQCATVPMLHTHPIALADPMAPIPSPQQLAPHVFFNYPANPAPSNQQVQQPQQRSPQAQQPPVPPQPPKPPQQPPQQPQQPQQKSQNNPPKGNLDDFDGALSDTVLKSLNKQLNDPDEGTRASAATDFCNILQKHPKLATDPAYKPYVNALNEKVMADPSSLVRGVGEMTLQLGLIKEPNDNVRSALKKLSLKDDANLTKENDQASSILTALENGTLGNDIVDTRDKDKKNGEKTGDKGATPGASGTNPQDPNAKGVNGPASGQSPGQSEGAGAAGQPNGQTAPEQSQGASQGAQAPEAQAQGDPNSSAMTKVPGVAGGAPPTPAPANNPGADNAASTPDASGAAAAAPPAGNTPGAAMTGQAPGAPGLDPTAGAMGGAPGGAQGGASDPAAMQVGQAPQQAMPWGGQNASAAGMYGASPYAAQNVSPSNYGIPQKMATGGGFGHKLNLMSHAPQSFLPSWLQSNSGQSNMGQRLNMYEGQTT